MLPDYFGRAAVAILQADRAADEAALRDLLCRQVIEIVLGPDAAQTEGRALADLLVRLVARLYPNLRITGPEPQFVEELCRLASRINPRITITSEAATAAVIIGAGTSVAPQKVYAGSIGWDAHIDSASPQAVGGTSLPFGAGAAACLAAANLFRVAFEIGPIDAALVFSTLSGTIGPTVGGPEAEVSVDLPSALVGVGAIGEAACWTLARAPIRGRLHLIDDELLDLGNLQRYVVAEREDEGVAKVSLGVRALSGRLIGVPHRARWADVTVERGHTWERVLVAVDSAAGRRAVQATLPAWIVNGWTQLGDMGVSQHVFDDDGPCLYCAYLPSGTTRNRDELVAAELRIPERLREVRELLHRNAPAPAEMRQAIATAFGLTPGALDGYADRPLALLHREGICGMGIVGVGSAGAPRGDVHVPLAHQSALAGVLLAAAFFADLSGAPRRTDSELRIDLDRPFTAYSRRPVAKDRSGHCICADADYLLAFANKHRVREE